MKIASLDLFLKYAHLALHVVQGRALQMKWAWDAGWNGRTKQRHNHTSFSGRSVQERSRRIFDAEWESEVWWWWWWLWLIASQQLCKWWAHAGDTWNACYNCDKAVTKQAVLTLSPVPWIWCSWWFARRSARSSNVSLRIVVSLPGAGGSVHSLQQSALANRNRYSLSWKSLNNCTILISNLAPLLSLPSCVPIGSVAVRGTLSRADPPDSSGAAPPPSIGRH